MDQVTRWAELKDVSLRSGTAQRHRGKSHVAGGGVLWGLGHSGNGRGVFERSGEHERVVGAVDQGNCGVGLGPTLPDGTSEEKFTVTENFSNIVLHCFKFKIIVTVGAVLGCQNRFSRCITLGLAGKGVHAQGEHGQRDSHESGESASSAPAERRRASEALFTCFCLHVKQVLV